MVQLTALASEEQAPAVEVVRRLVEVQLTALLVEEEAPAVEVVRRVVEVESPPVQVVRGVVPIFQMPQCRMRFSTCFGACYSSNGHCFVHLTQIPYTRNT